MKKLLVIALSLFLLWGCDDSESNEKVCSPECSEWQTCSDGACVLTEGKCETNTNCNTGFECNLESHNCVEIPVCDPTCEEWQTCNDGACVLTEGKCETNDSCTEENAICDLTTHECRVLTCNETLTPSGITDVEACSAINSKGCWSNDDCEEGQRCENVGGEYELACCVDGLRGCKAPGESCSSEFDCDSSLCLNRNEGEYFCSKICEVNTDCPEGFECADMYFFFACALPKQEQ
ncbi:hypothetical protein JXR93_08845 [bacterium]|nr:hypothetical protein [bacterium]